MLMNMVFDGVAVEVLRTLTIPMTIPPDPKKLLPRGRAQTKYIPLPFYTT